MGEVKNFINMENHNSGKRGRLSMLRVSINAEKEELRPQKK